MVDDGTAAILEAVASGGFYGRTLVVVASDNGGSIDDGGNNLPHRGGKRTMFEGGVKVSERGECAHGSLLTSSRAAFSVGRSGRYIGRHTSVDIRLEESIARCHGWHSRHAPLPPSGLCAINGRLLGSCLRSLGTVLVASGVGRRLQQQQQQQQQ